MSEELKSHFDSLHSKFKALHVTASIYTVLERADFLSESIFPDVAVL